MNIALIAGGISAEREVSLNSSRFILKALRFLGHSVKVIDPIFGNELVEEDIIFKDKISKDYPTFEKIKELQDKKSVNLVKCINSELFDDIDFAFIGLHGKYGEDGKIQTLLELSNIKYSGSGVLSSAVAMDKNISKSIFLNNNILTPDWFIFNKSEVISYDECFKRFGLPMVIKPNDEGSTVGLTIVKKIEEFEDAVKIARSFSDKILIEKYIKGRELTVAVVDDIAYPVVEVKPIDGFYDYEHKYSKGKTDYFCPADIEESVSEKSKALAIKAHRALGCEVYSRVDFLLTEDNELYCLEVNTLPGMTELSLVPKATAVMNMSFNELVQKIIDVSLKKYV